MKVDCHGNFHLTYCTNIHPGESWKEVFANLKTYLLPLKERLLSDRPFGVGLRLADVAARELCLEDNLKSFQEWLNQHDLYVFTLNGFPYGGFHRQVVKDRVYAPDWSRPERLDYTLRLAEILATLLPEGMDGGISTVPLSYKPWWENQPSAAATVRQNCCANLARFVAEIIRIREQTGKQLHVDLEPEPDGLIENTAEAIDFFQQDLLPEGGAFLVRTLGISRGAAERELLAGIRLCYDTCHFAVEYEEPRSALTRLLAAGISIGKVQLSAALQVDLGDSVQQRRVIAEHLRPFAESTYLHQTIERNSDGSLQRYRDLEIALPFLEKTLGREWRIHFHVPIFIGDYSTFRSTQEHITSVLHYLKENPICSQLEIETYTWDVLPSSMKADILLSIAREYEWVLSILSDS